MIFFHNSTVGNWCPGGLPTLRWRSWEEALGGSRFWTSNRITRDDFTDQNGDLTNPGADLTWLWLLTKILLIIPRNIRTTVVLAADLIPQSQFFKTQHSYLGRRRLRPREWWVRSRLRRCSANAEMGGTSILPLLWKGFFCCNVNPGLIIVWLCVTIGGVPP